MLRAAMMPHLIAAGQVFHKAGHAARSLRDIGCAVDLRCGIIILHHDTQRRAKVVLARPVAVAYRAARHRGRGPASVRDKCQDQAVRSGVAGRLAAGRLALQACQVLSGWASPCGGVI